ncbi:MAG TPA: hypothetical protein PK493_16235, partial [Pseudomonadota bacterium]|nr:hypothetical protein [Pseudomonadota bacterium]
MLFLGSCSKELLCLRDPNAPGCELLVSFGALPAHSLIAKEVDTQFAVQISKRPDGQHESSYPIWFVDPVSAGSGVRVGEATYLRESDDRGGLYAVVVGKNNPQFMFRHRYAVRVGIPGSETAPKSAAWSDPMVTTVKRTIRYQTPTVLAQKMQAQTDYPQLRLLGMVGNALVGAGSGASGVGTPGQKLKAWTGASLSNGTVGSFWSAPVEASVQIGTTGNRVLLGNPTNSVWAKCGLDAKTLTD